MVWSVCWPVPGHSSCTSLLPTLWSAASLAPPCISSLLTPLTAPQPLLLWITWIALHWTSVISALLINYTLPFFPPTLILLVVWAHLCLFYKHLATHGDRVLKQLSWWGLNSRQNAMLVTQALLTEELAQTFSHPVQHIYIAFALSWRRGHGHKHHHTHLCGCEQSSRNIGQVKRKAPASFPMWCTQRRRQGLGEMLEALCSQHQQWHHCQTSFLHCPQAKEAGHGHYFCTLQPYWVTLPHTVAWSWDLLCHWWHPPQAEYWV